VIGTPARQWVDGTGMDGRMCWVRVGRRVAVDGPLGMWLVGVVGCWGCGGWRGCVALWAGWYSRGVTGWRWLEPRWLGGGLLAGLGLIGRLGLFEGQWVRMVQSGAVGRMGGVEGGGRVWAWLGGWVHIGGGTGSMQVRGGWRAGEDVEAMSENRKCLMCCLPEIY
jgi:hypothetical protein